MKGQGEKSLGLGTCRNNVFGDLESGHSLRPSQGRTLASLVSFFLKAEQMVSVELIRLFVPGHVSPLPIAVTVHDNK